MGTARDLTITSWVKEPADTGSALAVPGLKITGWWPAVARDPKSFDALRTIWLLEAATLKIEQDILEDPDGKKHQLCVYARIRRYPEPWMDAVRNSLAFVVEQGAAISWAGGWECFLQYSPIETFAGCYAAYTSSTGLVCFSDLDEPIRYLDQVPGVPHRLHLAVAAQLRRGTIQ